MSTASLGDVRLPIRFWSKLTEDPDTDCWLWQASIRDGGYGQVHWEGKARRAHRVAYGVLVGPVPCGLELDHLCRVRRCVNPAHLEPVTRVENTRRGLAGQIHRERRAFISSCPYGHEYDAVKPRQRVCTACRRADDRRAYWLRKQKQQQQPQEQHNG